MRLVGEQQVVHLPEPALRGRRLRGFGRLQRVRMRFLEGEVPEHQPHAVGVTIEKQLYPGRRHLARRAFEVAVLDDRDGRMVGTQRVVGGLHRHRQTGSHRLNRRRHTSSLPRREV